MNLEKAELIGDLLVLVDRWCDAFEKSKDCYMGGKKIEIRDLIKGRTNSGLLEVMSIENGTTVGFCAHLVKDGYLDGVALWIEPEHRGNIEIVFDLLLSLAKERGLNGICFSSKIYLITTA